MSELGVGTGRGVRLAPSTGSRFLSLDETLFGTRRSGFFASAPHPGIRSPVRLATGKRCPLSDRHAAAPGHGSPRAGPEIPAADPLGPRSYGGDFDPSSLCCDCLKLSRFAVDCRQVPGEAKRRAGLLFTVTWLTGFAIHCRLVFIVAATGHGFRYYRHSPLAPTGLGPDYGKRPKRCKSRINRIIGFSDALSGRRTAERIAGNTVATPKKRQSP